MALKDFDLKKRIKSFPYIVDGKPQQFQAICLGLNYNDY